MSAVGLHNLPLPKAYTRALLDGAWRHVRSLGRIPLRWRFSRAILSEFPELTALMGLPVLYDGEQALQDIVIEDADGVDHVFGVAEMSTDDKDTEVRAAAQLLRNYYDQRVADAAAATLASTETRREECLDIQGYLAVTTMAPVVGGYAILCGLATERGQRVMQDTGVPTDANKGLDYRALAAQMFMEDVRAELEARELDAALAGVDGVN